MVMNVGELYPGFARRFNAGCRFRGSATKKTQGADPEVRPPSKAFGGATSELDP